MTLISRFTPRMYDEQKLERLFVNREKMLQSAVERIREASISGRRSHVLYVGPRGAGKTHLVSLIYHRAKKLNEFGEGFAISWLPEDPWGLISYEKLMSEIEKNSEPLLYETQLHPSLNVVLVENLDRVLTALGREGQQQLRARLERGGDILLIATSTRLTDYMIEQAQPFYGFFDTIELKPFTLDEAIIMLRRIAELDGDRTLVTRLGEPDTRARLAAIERLAGGQPRIWAFLAVGLTTENLKNFVDLLLECFDDLTPYYQEQLGRLSSNELQAVWALIETDGAMTVQAIAAATGIEQRSLAKTLRGLSPAWMVPRKGYLMQFVDKRLTYYQLSEPLARLALQIKASKGRPIKLAVNFLTAWYSRDELELTTRHMREWQPSFEFSGEMAQAYVEEAQAGAQTPGGRFRQHLLMGTPTLQYSERYPAKPDEAVIAECARVDGALAELQNNGSAQTILSLPTGIAEILEEQLQENSVGLVRNEIALLAVRSGGDERWLQNTLDSLVALKPHEERMAQLILGSIRLLLKQTEAGLATFDSALSQDTAELTSREWEIIATTATCPVRPLSEEAQVGILCRTAAYIADSDLPTFAGISLAGKRSSAADKQLIATLTKRITGSDFSGVLTRNELLTALQQNVDFHAPEWFGPRMSIALYDYLYGKTAHDKKNLAEIIEEAKAHPDFEIAKRLQFEALLVAIDTEFDNAKESIDTLERIVQEATTELGSEHSATLRFRGNLANQIGKSGNPEDALVLYNSLLDDYVRIFGPDHPDTLFIREKIASLTYDAGNPEDALALYDSLLDDFVRVFGSDYPLTLLIRDMIESMRRVVVFSKISVAAKAASFVFKDTEK
jgi:replication-associated recombination protein RarA